MPVFKIPPIPTSEVTDESVWKQRRRLLQLAMAAPLVWAERGLAGSKVPEREATASDPDLDLLDESKKIPNVASSAYSTDETPTAYRYVSTYNNYLELGSGKASPAENASDLITEPWTVTVDGECEAPGVLDMDKVFRLFPQEERIYRLRCVEAWAMVVPWVGFSLGDLLKRFKPTSKAKYVEFETLFDPKHLAGQRGLPLQWPYREGLRMDEAMHPLTMIATGVYGRVLPNQNGAPLRLVVPWKYGFKSIKSIVRITFTEKEPATTWNDMQPEEYGFYANVNPAVSHPRWSQKHHRMIGGGLFSGRVPTLPFNGYAEQVASLYSGMDLKKFY